MDVGHINNVQLMLGMDFSVTNQWGTIWVFHKFPLSCSIVEKSCQHLSLQVQYQLLPSTVYFSFVYAKCTVQERQMLWADLMVGTPSDVPWFLTGDFNVIVNDGEQRGG